MTEGQSPIFSKTYDFILWLLDLTEKFPKNERFRMARRLEDTAFTYYEFIIQAAHHNSKRTPLMSASLELDKLKLYFRLSHARKLVTSNQYQYAAEALIEIGKLLGGWIKAISG